MDPSAPEAPGRPVDASAAVVVRNLSKRYEGRAAVDDLSFEVRPRAVTGFLGPNGAGKTTTLRMVLGLARPTRGQRADLRPALRALDDPARTVGAVARGLRLPPGPLGPRPPALARRAGGLPPAGSTRSSTSSSSRSAAGAARASTRWACASASRWPRRCSATREVLVLDEPANGLDPQRHPLAARLPARQGRRGPHGARLQPRALRGRPDGRRRRRDLARAAHLPGDHPRLHPPRRRRPTRVQATDIARLARRSGRGRRAARRATRACCS